MKIIVEGPDGAGKTTLVNALVKKYNLNKVVFTKEGYKNFNSYMSYKNIDNVVFDRCFLSEVIYQNVFKRDRVLDIHEEYALLQNYFDDTILIILNADLDTLKKRLEIRGDEEESVIDQLNLIKNLYDNYSKYLRVPTFNIENIDAIYEYIEKELNK